jgi:hypothetical protein
MKDKIEKKHFIFNGINIVFVGNEQSKIAYTVNTEGLTNLKSIVFSLSSGRSFFLNDKRFNAVVKYQPEDLNSIIAEVDVIIYFDASDEEINNCEQLRKTNPDCIAIDLIQTGLSFNECLGKISYLIDHAKSSKLQAKILDKYKSELFLLGTIGDEKSNLQILPPEVAQIIAVEHILSCNYSSLSFFKKMPEEQVDIDKSSASLLNK